MAAATHIVSSSAKLHGQRFTSAGQVAKSKLCFGEILVLSSFTVARLMAENFSLSFDSS